MKQIKKVACYYRVSTEGQVENDTIAAQRKFLPEWARQQGWEIVAEFEDPGISGTTLDKRPGCLALLEQVRAGKFDAVVVRHSDRITRTPFLDEWGLIFGAFQRSGTLIASPNEGITNLEELGGQVLSFVQGRLASEESIKRKERAEDGARRAQKENRCHGGRIPYGATWDNVTKTWGVNEIEYEALKEAMLMLESGIGIDTIVKKFNQSPEKYPTKIRPALVRKIGDLEKKLASDELEKKERKETEQKLEKAKSRLANNRWHPGSLWQMLQNDFYFNGELGGKYSIVQTGLTPFTEAQITRARSHIRKRAKKKDRGTDKWKFLLRDIANCDECGWKISVQGQNSSNGGTLKYYRCKKCGKGARAENIDRQALAEFMLKFGDKSALQWKIMKEQFVSKDRLARLKKKVEAAKVELTEVRNKRERGAEHYYDGVWSKEKWQNEKRRLDQKESNLLLEKQQNEMILNKPDLVMEAAEKLAAECAERIQRIVRFEEYVRLRKEWDQLDQSERDHIRFVTKDHPYLEAEERMRAEVAEASWSKRKFNLEDLEQQLFAMQHKLFSEIIARGGELVINFKEKQLRIIQVVEPTVASAEPISEDYMERCTKSG